MRWNEVFSLPAWRGFFVFALLFVLALSVLLIEGCVAGAEEAALAIERAEGVVVSGYQIVLEAEQARANISRLLARLNEAGELLALARVSYRVGDFDGAVLFAELCGEIVDGVKVDALGLRNLAVEEAGHRFWWAIIGSIVGVSIIVFLSFLSWFIFKGRYYRRVLEMRPEVVSGGS